MFRLALIVTPVFAQFAQMSNQQGHQQSGGQDMFSMMCDMMTVPGLCKSKGQGRNSAECKANPSACCPAAVQACSDTDPFNVFTPACPKSMGTGAKCVGSEMMSMTKVGVCMCQQGGICQGSGTNPTCAGGAASTAVNAMNTAMHGFSRLYEDGEVAEEVLNVEGWVAAACYAGFFSLLILLAVRGVRYLRRSNEEVQVHTALIEDDAEAVQEWSSWRWHQDSAWHCRRPVNSSARYHTAEQIHNQQNRLFQVAPTHLTIFSGWMTQHSAVCA